VQERLLQKCKYICFHSCIVDSSIYTNEIFSDGLFISENFFRNVNLISYKNNFLTFFKVGTIIASCNMWFGLK